MTEPCETQGVSVSECDFRGGSADDLAKRVAGILADPKTFTSEEDKDSYVLALCGPWGAGKTHFVKKVAGALRDQSAVDGLMVDGARKPLEVVWFDPWAFGEPAQIVFQLFAQLAEKLPSSVSVELPLAWGSESGSVDQDPQGLCFLSDASSGRDKSGFKSKVSSRIVSICEAFVHLGSLVAGGASVANLFLPGFPYLASASVFGSFAAAVADMGAAFASRYGRDGSDSDRGSDEVPSDGVPSGVLDGSISGIHDCIRDAMGSDGVPMIVVIVDNIDRMSGEDIALLFQTISTVADFPKVRYLLSFDYDLVAGSLASLQPGIKCGVESGSSSEFGLGERYLQKVVVDRIDLPVLKLPDLVDAHLKVVAKNAMDDEKAPLFGDPGGGLGVDKAITAVFSGPRHVVRSFGAWETNKRLSEGCYKLGDTPGSHLIECVMREISDTAYRAVADDWQLDGGERVRAVLSVRPREDRGSAKTPDVYLKNKVADKGRGMEDVVSPTSSAVVEWDEAMMWYEGLFGIRGGSMLRTMGVAGSLGVPEVVRRLDEGVTRPKEERAMRFWLALKLAGLALASKSSETSSSMKQRLEEKTDSSSSADIGSSKPSSFFDLFDGANWSDSDDETRTEEDNGKN